MRPVRCAIGPADLDVDLDARAAFKMMENTGDETVEDDIVSDSLKYHLESRFECPICLNCLRDPVLTPCGHKFCSRCINSWLEKDKGTYCPVDSKPLKASNLFTDLCTKREISELRTSCPYRRFGCCIILSPIDMETHANRCEKRQSMSEANKFSCVFKDVGCSRVFENEAASRSHLEENVQEHLTMVGSALSKLNGTNVTNVTARAAESKLWDAPAKNKLASSDADQPSADWEQLLKNLYERVVVLEQQNREYSIAIRNQRKQLTSLQTAMQVQHEEVTLRNCNGLYVWRLPDFREKLAAMREDPLKMYYSPGFYTSSNGYKLCARLNVSSKDPQFLSLLLHMMRSECDDALDWPFDGTMHFALLHPHDSEKDIREVTASVPDLEAFRKPSCELNKRSFGYTEFVRLSDVVEFLRDDELLFRIEVRPRRRF